MNEIKRALIEGKFINNAILYVDYYASVLMRSIVFRNSPIQNNKIFVMTFDRKYTCNPKYIIEELLKRHPDADVVWVVDPKMQIQPDDYPHNVRLVTYATAEMFEEMATAKVWLDNAINCVWHDMPKKKEQIYLNTWHGSLGIKKLSGNSRWLRRAARCKKVTDYCITNSTFEENVFRTTFWPATDFLKFGHARNDILLDEEKIKAAREKVLRHYKLNPETRICLYAPTFRDDKNTQVYDLSYEVLKEALEKRFGGEWVIFARAHFKNRSNTSAEPEKDYVINASEYLDIQELMAAADAGVTDYSSWAFDYILTGRPVFVYAPDIEKYANGRGFYYPIETTPFPIAENNDELLKKIVAFDQEQYTADVKQFLEEKGCYESGHAAEKVVDFLEENMEL